MNHKLDTDTHVFFYEQDFYVLSNFSSFQIRWVLQREGSGEPYEVVFPTSEHLYHFHKFHGVNNGIAEQVANAPSAHESFKVAERNKGNRRPDWDDVKLVIMKRILRAKAEQHEYVRRKLLATGSRTLIEDSWRDDYWGWGPNKDGQNWLGRLWMEVRSELERDPLAPAVI